MKKILFVIAGLLLVSLAFLLVAEIVSFKVVKQTTDQINKDLNNKFQKIVRIPQIVPPSYKGLDRTEYSWEMETPQKEIIRVYFSHDTGFSSSQNTINATLYMAENADASLFNKVLPAVISDPQALFSAQNQQQANLGANGQAGYNKITIVPVPGDGSKITKITWEFDKNQLIKGDEELYKKLAKFPNPLLKLLYGLQNFTIRIFAA